MRCAHGGCEHGVKDASWAPVVAWSARAAGDGRTHCRGICIALDRRILQRRGSSSSMARWVRDEEAAGSNPATPTGKFQVDGMIAKRGGHAVDHSLAIRWRDRTSVRGMRRGGSAGNATAAGHRPSRVERLPGPPLLWCHSFAS